MAAASTMLMVMIMRTMITIMMMMMVMMMMMTMCYFKRNYGNVTPFRAPPPAPAPCFQSPLYSTVQLSLSQGNVPNDPMWNDFVTALSKETGRTVQDLNTLGEFYTDSLVQDLNTQVSFIQTVWYRTSTH